MCDCYKQINCDEIYYLGNYIQDIFNGIIPSTIQNLSKAFIEEVVMIFEYPFPGFNPAVGIEQLKENFDFFSQFLTEYIPTSVAKENCDTYLSIGTLKLTLPGDTPIEVIIPVIIKSKIVCDKGVIKVRYFQIFGDFISIFPLTS